MENNLEALKEAMKIQPRISDAERERILSLPLYQMAAREESLLSAPVSLEMEIDIGCGMWRSVDFNGHELTLGNRVRVEPLALDSLSAPETLENNEHLPRT